MSRKKNLRKAAEETTHSAAEQAAAAIDVAVSFLAPYVEAAKDSVGPAAKHAAHASADLAHKAKSGLEPHVQDALDLVSPAVEGAKAKVQADLLPKLVDLLHEAEKHPAIREAEKRGAATLAAVKGDLVLPKQRTSHRVGRTIAKVIAATALLAGAAVAVRQFLASKDNGWTAHDATVPTTPPPAPPTAPAAPAAAEAPAAPDAPMAPTVTADETVDLVTPDVTTHDVTTTDEAESTESPESPDDVVSEGARDAVMVAEGAPVFAEKDDPSVGAAGDPFRYGEGSFVGATPPESYTIKGNERSMKYHVPESGGYDRTIADVWFSSEEAASAAGFTRAQR